MVNEHSEAGPTAVFPTRSVLVDWFSLIVEEPLVPVHQWLRRPAGDERLHQREAGEQEREAHDGRQDEGDHLVARRSRQAGADREEAACHEQAAQVGGEDGAVVRVAQVIDRFPGNDKTAP